ncbi:gliding motility-associated C-terminal domain-containing protein [Daejeonella oryzae]|uniref:gliding motility-associated C-terminal domain-containing protein n=1 Tax=Daejeonella oryzae TaxID=1122943 RepID=UPI0004017C1F|nr:gliding motility-associated C-terminal domain-containing protein [Daejeonella oryzae]
MNYFKTTYFILLFFLLSLKPGIAQTCNGSLGDPVVNITFGEGYANAMPLPPNVTSYKFSTDACPGDGFYNIASQTQNCFGSTWHSVVQDHTPNDVNGNMMVINASLDPGDFYTQKVTGLCGGTTYEFASWILNILKNNACESNGIDPNITFTIENSSGVILRTYSTGNIAETLSPQWKQFGFFFTTPAGTEEVVIRMTNKSVGGCGNDLALDDITFRACGPTITAESEISSLTNALCEGESGTINLNAEISAGYTNPSFQWQINSNDGEGWKDIISANQRSYSLNIPAVNQLGYSFRLAAAEGANINSQNCRILSAQLPVLVNRKPTVDAGSDLVIIEGGIVALNGSAEGNNTRYFWTPSSYLDNPNILNPTANPPENITYTLNVISEDGCNSTVSDEVYIRVLKNLIIPNAFSPNADMVNDRWKIVALNSYPESRIHVFNRYGNTVFKSVGYGQEWDGNFDGKPLPSGVYYYTIDLRTGSPVLTGSVLIVR